MEIVEKPPTIKGSEKTFTGDVWLDSITRGMPHSRLNVAAVRFSPGSRTAWHSHRGGQTLYVTEGHGLIQTRDGHTSLLRPGDVVYAPDGEEHWHGATGSDFMSHLSITEQDPDWLEHVEQDEYERADSKVKRKPQ